MAIRFDSSLSGIERATTRFAKTADRVAEAGTGLPGEGDLGRDLTSMNVEKSDVAANVKVVRAKDEMLGTLIDVIA